MRYRWADLPHVLRTSRGRAELITGQFHRAFPLTSRVAGLYRRTLIRGVRVVAVTGSSGKTTTARMLRSALGLREWPDSWRNDLAFLPRAILRISPGDRFGVIEAGIDARGQMARIARVVRPDVAVATSVGIDHRRELGSTEGIRAEKANLVRALSPSGLAVLNGDDPNVMWMAGQSRARVVTYGFGGALDVRAEEVSLDWPHGMRFQLVTGSRRYECRIRLLGRYMVYPALAAVATAICEGVPVPDAIRRIADTDPVPGRMEVTRLASGAILIGDYASSNEDTVHAALRVLAEIPAQRRFVVLADISHTIGNARDAYRSIGASVARVADSALFWGSKNVASYRAEAVRTGMPREALEVLPRHSPPSAVTEWLKERLGPGDVALIKGRGGQKLGRVVLALSGRDVRCELSHCHSEAVACHHCGMLACGWEGKKAVF